MEFKSKVGGMIIGMICTLSILAIFTFLSKAYIAAGAVGLVVLYLVWSCYNTRYTINGNQLHYRSGFVNGSINIDSIVEVVKNATKYAGLKPALSANGLVVRYTKYDDIYISPADADGFIEALKSINRDIKVAE